MSTSEFFELPETVQRLHEGPLAAHIDAYASRLLEQGFSSGRARDRIRLVADFSRWLHREKLGATDVNPETVDRYLKTQGRHIHSGRGAPAALQELLNVLCCENVTGREQCFVKAVEPCQREEQNFERYLSQERGLSERTLENYLPFVHQLLQERFGSGPIDFAKLHASDITQFVQRHAYDHSRSRTGAMVAALRAFLSHLRYRRAITTDLAACVPTVANWSFATVPKYLRPGEVQQVLRHCDRNCATQRRDYAILLLLARLGLRAGEVVRLTLDDIDWKEGTLRLRDKRGREAKLPVPVEVGEALADYLQNVRPRVVSRRLFIRQRAPRVGLGRTAISLIVRRALSRAQVDSPRKGAHLFRHTLATEMLGRGASLTEIGQILRHEHPRTTMIYAKVNIPALRRLAPAWPGGGR